MLSTRILNNSLSKLYIYKVSKCQKTFKMQKIKKVKVTLWVIIFFKKEAECENDNNIL